MFRVYLDFLFDNTTSRETPALNHSISCMVMNSFPMSGGETLSGVRHLAA